MGNCDDTSSGSICVPEIVEQPCGLYPAPETFSSGYGAADYCEWVEQSNGDPLPAPLVLYLQNEAGDAPISPDVSTGSLNQTRAIELELRLQGALFDADRPLSQLICGDSIAAGWNDDALYRLISVIQSSFFIKQDGFSSWCACTGGEVPSMHRLRLLRVLGFNQLRFTPHGRHDAATTATHLRSAIEQARQLGFDKISVDWRQVPVDAPAWTQVANSLLSDVQPDRMRISAPTGESQSRFEQRMSGLGYSNIGLDWYLRESDEWWLARAADRLYWTLLGYSELKSPDTIGIGPGAISAVCEFYGINETSLRRYSVCMDEGVLPIVQGTVLEDSDVLRREIIAMILTRSCIRVPDIENKWGIEFERYFACEAELLRAFAKNGWVSWQGDRIEVKPRGVRELAEICRVFDGRADNPLTLAPHTAAGTSPGRARTRIG